MCDRITSHAYSVLVFRLRFSIAHSDLRSLVGWRFPIAHGDLQSPVPPEMFANLCSSTCCVLCTSFVVVPQPPFLEMEWLRDDFAPGTRARRLTHVPSHGEYPLATAVTWTRLVYWGPSPDCVGCYHLAVNQVPRLSPRHVWRFAHSDVCNARFCRLAADRAQEWEFQAKKGNKMPLHLLPDI